MFSDHKPVIGKFMIRLQSELIFDKSEAMSIHMKEDNDILKESRKRKDA